MHYDLWTKAVSQEGITYRTVESDGTDLSRTLAFDKIRYIHVIPHTGLLWYWGGKVLVAEYPPMSEPVTDDEHLAQPMLPFGLELYFGKDVDRLIAALEVLCPNLRTPPTKN